MTSRNCSLIQLYDDISITNVGDLINLGSPFFIWQLCELQELLTGKQQANGRKGSARKLEHNIKWYFLDIKSTYSVGRISCPQITKFKNMLFNQCLITLSLPLARTETTHCEFDIFAFSSQSFVADNKRCIKPLPCWHIILQLGW